MKYRILKFIANLLGATWIVSLSDGKEHTDEGEMGFRILGMNFWYYKWDDPMISESRPWRIADKREFGEVVHSLKFGALCSCPEGQPETKN